MTRILLAAAMTLAAGAAWAQPAPPPGPAPRPNETAAPAPKPAGIGGAHIKIHRPDISVAVRCADGDTTRACGEIVAQLIEKLAAMPQSERRGGGERTRDTDRMGGGYRDRESEGRYRDRD